jgi:hypothetical protein
MNRKVTASRWQQLWILKVRTGIRLDDRDTQDSNDAPPEIVLIYFNTA